jgi:hypothetical protein
LVHGIRTEAAWAELVADTLRRDCDAEVVPIRYGYFDVFRFWSPFWTRHRVIARISRELRDVRTSTGANPSVLSHSFGTYALAEALRIHSDIHVNHVILCGSIVRDDFRWDRLAPQIHGRIVNECGTRDIWPPMAAATSWGYGPTGTFGFGSARVRDRYHNVEHSEFFTPTFVSTFWSSLLGKDEVIGSAWDLKRPAPPWWMSVLRLLPIQWLIILVLLAVPIGYQRITTPHTFESCLSLRWLLDIVRPVHVPALKHDTGWILVGVYDSTAMHNERWDFSQGPFFTIVERRTRSDSALPRKGDRIRIVELPRDVMVKTNDKEQVFTPVCYGDYDHATDYTGVTIPENGIVTVQDVAHDCYADREHTFLWVRVNRPGK